MKGKKCPYCGRRIPYMTVFHEKKRGKYTCTRCKKDCKIKTDFKLILAFAVVALLVVLYIIFWMGSSFHNQLIGVLPPIILLIIFYFCTPLFVRFVPLKEVMKKEEIKSKSIEISETEEENYTFDRNVFEQIKQNRNTPADMDSKIDRVEEEFEEPVIPVIKNVSEAHASSDAPLKKMSKSSPKDQPRELTDEYDDEDIKQYVPKKAKPDGSKYTANRKF